MKLNKKGFMMAEVVVVSAIVLSFLAILYSSYNKTYSAYKTRLSYYDTVSLYRLVYYRDILIENKSITTAFDKADTDSNHIASIYSTENNSGMIELPAEEKPTNIIENSFLINNRKTNLNGNELDSVNVNPTFKDYIKYLSTSTKIESNYVMVIERCNNIDDCKYAYLEVYDGKE